MLKFYKTLFNENLLELKQFINDLERKTGFSGQDIRLHNKLNIKLISKIKELNLDPIDSNSFEIYHGLLNKLKEDDRKLYLSLRNLAGSKINAEANLNDGFKLLTKNIKLENLLVIKPTYLKKYFKNNPPKNLLKALHYRTVDSLIKRENLSLIVLGINYFESENYIHKYYLNYKNLNSLNFKTADLEIIFLNNKWQTALKGLIKKIDKVNLSIPELGSLIIVPCQNAYKPGKSIYYYSSIIYSIYKINLYSTYLKYHLPYKNFNQLFYNSTKHPLKIHSSFFNRDISWEVIYRYLFKKNNLSELELFKTDEFIHFTKIFKSLELSKDLNFWFDTYNLGSFLNNQFVSFNILDNAYNLYHNLDYPRTKINHFINEMKVAFYLGYLNKNNQTSNLLSYEYQTVEN